MDSLEVTKDRDVILSCGGSKTKGVLVAFSFDGHFDFIDKLEFDDQVVKVRRLKNEDIFIVGSWATIFFTQYVDKKITKLASIDCLCGGLLTHIECSRNNVYLLEERGIDFRRIEFGFELESYQSGN